MAHVKWCGGGALWCRCAGTLLLHVNLLLALFGGASLATAARLKWDPSTYIAVRELFPVEYRVCAIFLAVGGVALLLLPQLAAAALHASKQRAACVLLYIYAGAVLALVVCEVVLCAWLVHRVMEWLVSETALHLFQARAVYTYLKPVFNFISRLHPLPAHVNDLTNEAAVDAPRNLYILGTVGLVLALLQPLAILLALGVACYKGCYTNNIKGSQSSSGHPDYEKDSLHAPALVSRNKPIVIIPARLVRAPRALPPYHNYEEV